MKLLVLTNNPNRPSFRQRIEIHLQSLRRNGIHCEVAKLPSEELGRLKIFKLAMDFDGVFLHKKTLNLLNAGWLRHYAHSVIYDFDDAVMYYDKHPERKPSRYKHTNPFKRTIKLAELVIAGNPYLAEHAEKFNYNVKVLPTGLDTKAYNLEIKPKDDSKIRLVWIGSKSTLKYLAEIKPALEEIGKRFDNVILRIISDDFFDLQNMEVEKCRWSLESQAIDLATSDIGLAPLPDNRFTRGKCGFKILQYASAGLPIVASPVSVNTEYIDNGVSGFHAITILQWIEKIGELIKNTELRKRMGEKSLARVKFFDIAIIGEKLLELIKKCLQDSKVWQ